MLVCALSVHIAHETAGAARIRHSLRPLIREGEEFPHNSGASCREIEKLRLAVIASEAKQSIARRNERMDCFVANAPRNDVEGATLTPANSRAPPAADI